MQDKTDLSLIYCDICHNVIGTKEVCIRLPLYTLFSGDMGPGVLICRQCADLHLGVNKQVFADV